VRHARERHKRLHSAATEYHVARKVERKHRDPADAHTASHTRLLQLQRTRERIVDQAEVPPCVDHEEVGPPFANLQGENCATIDQGHFADDHSLGGECSTRKSARQQTGN
jgi:hypothetical protein